MGSSNAPSRKKEKYRTRDYRLGVRVKLMTGKVGKGSHKLRHSNPETRLALLKPAVMLGESAPPYQEQLCHVEVIAFSAITSTSQNGWLCEKTTLNGTTAKIPEDRGRPFAC